MFCLLTYFHRVDCYCHMTIYCSCLWFVRNGHVVSLVTWCSVELNMQQFVDLVLQLTNFRTTFSSYNTTILDLYRNGSFVIFANLLKNTRNVNSFITRWKSSSQGFYGHRRLTLTFDPVTISMSSEQPDCLVPPAPNKLLLLLFLWIKTSCKLKTTAIVIYW